MKFRFGEQSFLVSGLIYNVRNRLGMGWPEEIYHQALVEALKHEGVPVLSKERKEIVHRGVGVHVFECDIMLWEKIILELKALPYSGFAAVHQAQIIHYLKCWNKGLGMLVNFAKPKVEIKRMLWDDPPLDLSENYEKIKPIMAENDMQVLQQIRQVILEIGEQYGLGYPESMYRKILAIELEACGLACLMNLMIPARWHERKLMDYETEHLLVANRYLVNVRSILERPPKYDFARMKTYLNVLGLSIGLIINFGKRQLQIFGIDPN
jgi:GxxExxY protein